MPPTDRARLPRVFLGVVEIAGYYRGLKKGFDELGVPCTFVNLIGHAFAYGGDEESSLVRAIRRVAAKPGRAMRILEQFLRALLIPGALLRHDVFIFGFGTSFLRRNLDLPILKAFRKTVVFQFHGSDSRPPFVDGAVMHVTGDRSIAECIRLTAERKRMLARIDRWADVIVDIPTQGHLHDRPFVLWLRIGLPLRPPRFPEKVPEPYRGAERPLRILHSPSDPIAKGSDRIKRTIEDLKAKGIALELVEIRGQPNAVVLDELERCDFVIDQLYADYAMPGFATEAAWFGKPVIIAGYARELWESLLSPEWRPPTHYCHPNDLAAAIERFARDPEYRDDLARRARTFVETTWSPKAVAQRYLDLVTKPIPPELLVDPKSIRYWQGVCHPEARARALLREFIAVGGREALQLSDKPELEALLVAESEKT